MTVIVWSNAAAAAVTMLRAQLPGRSEPFTRDARVVAHVPDGRTITSSRPLVMCRPDGAEVTRRLDQRAVVRITCWHATEFEAMQLTALAQGMVIAHTGPEILSAEYVSGPVPGIDPNGKQPLATAVVACHMRPNAV